MGANRDAIVEHDEKQGSFPTTIPTQSKETAKGCGAKKRARILGEGGKGALGKKPLMNTIFRRLTKGRGELPSVSVVSTRGHHRRSPTGLRFSLYDPVKILLLGWGGGEGCSPTVPRHRRGRSSGKRGMGLPGLCKTAAKIQRGKGPYYQSLDASGSRRD